MAKTRFVQSNFVSGEISPLLKGRTDVDQYYQAVETAENVVIVPQGGLKRRPGTQYIDDVIPRTEYASGTLSLPNGGNAAIATLLNETAYPTTTPIGTTDPYVVAKYDFGVNTLVTFFDIVGIALTAGQSDEFVIQSSFNDITYTTVQALPEITTTEQSFRYYLDSGNRYWRIARVGTTDLGSAVVSIVGVYAKKYIQPFDYLPVSLHSFNVDSDRNYLVAMTRDNIRIYQTPDTVIADLMPAPIGGPLLWDQVNDLRTAQLENVLLVFGYGQQPIRIVNLNIDSTAESPANWALDYIPFTNVPQYDFNDADSPTPVSDVQIITLSGGSLKEGDQFQIDVESVLSKNITFAGDTTTADREATVYNIQKNLQEMPVFGATGVSVARTGTLTYTVTISGESAKGFEQFTGFFTSGSSSNAINITRSVEGSPRKEDVWSALRGYPECACFYESRLVLANAGIKNQSIWLSKTGDFFNFDLDDGDDDEAIFATISSRALTNIVDLYPGRNLQIFTSGAEFAVTSKPSTPSTINIEPQTSNGASNVEAVDIDGATIFIDRHGKKVLEFVYSFNEDAYIANDKSVLASHLINQPVDMAILSGTESDSANWLFIVNADGTAAVLNTLRSQDINGFTKWTTDGDIKSVEVVDNELYMAVNRTDRGWTIERWSFDYRMDCSAKSNDIQAFRSLEGLAPLDNKDVTIVADAEGYVLGTKTAVADYKITLDEGDDIYSLYEVGLNFTPTIKPMPLNTNIGSGPNQMRLKKIVRMNLRVYESSGIHVDGIPVPVREFGSGALSTSPITPVSGIIEDLYDINGWEREVMPVITCPDPTPMHIQMIEYEVEGN